MKRNYKRLIVSMLALSMILVLTGCGDKVSPESTVDELFDSAKVLDFERIEGLVAEDAKEELDGTVNKFREDFIESSEEGVDYEDVEGYKEAMDSLKEIQKELSYKVKNIDESDNSAIVTVDVEYVNGQELISDTISSLFGEVMSQAFTGDELSEEDALKLTLDKFNKSYSDFEKVMKEETVDIHLVKDENDKWLVSEMDTRLINVLSFNMLDSIDNILSDMLGDFEFEGQIDGELDVDNLEGGELVEPKIKE